uniref:Uncharacterized protein n=1 Tax=Arion vulgaris TaxID=1028688 RepID=A0A0B6Y7J2_9EUPU
MYQTSYTEISHRNQVTVTGIKSHRNHRNYTFFSEMIKLMQVLKLDQQLLHKMACFGCTQFLVTMSHRHLEQIQIKFITDISLTSFG